MIGARDGAGVGRTMKEYEDQLEALKKENFNLKLRIYFLEERMGITSADENAIKKNIELKVSIRSELFPLHFSSTLAVKIISIYKIKDCTELISILSSSCNFV